MTKNSNLDIKKSVKQVFTKDEYDFYILGEFAKKGARYKYGLNFAEISGRQIARRVDKLEKEEFVHATKSTPYRNIEGQYTKIFELTSKGFIASLRVVNIEQNYLTKKMLQNVDNDELKTITLNYIKSDLNYFLKHNALRGIILDGIKDISMWFNEYDNHFGFSKDNERILKELKKVRKKQLDTLDEKIKLTFKEKKLKNMNNYLKKWHSSINSISHQKEFKEIIKKYSKEEPYKKQLSSSQIIEISNMMTEGVYIKTYAEYKKY